MSITTGTVLSFVLICGAAAACAGKTGGRQNPTKAMVDAPPTVVETRRDPRMNTIVLVRGSNLSQALENDPTFRSARSLDHAAAMARRFIEVYQGFFRLQRPEAELRAISVTGDELGFVHVRFQQVYGALNVWNAEIIVHLNAERQIYRVQGRYIPTPSGLDIKPVVSVDEARQAAAKALGRDACPSCEVELAIAATESPRLAYRVVTRPSIAEGWVITIDARDAAVIDKVSTVMPGTFHHRDTETQR